MKVNKLCIQFLFVTFLSFFYLSVYSQNVEQTKKDSLLPVEIKQILLEAQTLQTPFMIDVRLKAISLEKFKDVKRKKKILEDSFTQSFEVSEKYPKKYVSSGGTLPDIRPLYISYGSEKKLSRFSLQIRIVSEMYKVDKNRAFELFKQISPNLEIKPAACENLLLEDVKDFYDFVENTAQDYFTQKQINERERLNFLMNYVSAMKSHIQVSPTAKLLTTVKLDEYEENLLVNEFSRNLKIISDDDRAFTYTMYYGKQVAALKNLVKKIEEKNSLLSEPLKKSYREYVLKNLTGKRCEDNVKFENSLNDFSDKAERGETLTSYQKLFKDSYLKEANKSLFSDFPLNYKEIKPFDIEPFSLPDSYLNRDKASKLNEKIDDLRFWQSNNLTTETVKKEFEWQNQFSEVLEEIIDFKGEEKDEEIDVFHTKCTLFERLLSENPPLKFKEKVIESYLKILGNFSIQKKFPSEWLRRFDSLNSEIFFYVKSPDKERLQEIINNSNDPTIQIYIKIKRELKENEETVKNRANKQTED